jgi:hypothetical protein
MTRQERSSWAIGWLACMAARYGAHRYVRHSTLTLALQAPFGPARVVTAGTRADLPQGSCNRPQPGLKAWPRAPTGTWPASSLPRDASPRRPRPVSKQYGGWGLLVSRSVDQRPTLTA